MINELKNNLKKKDGKSVILHGDDDEFFKSLRAHERNKSIVQATHFLKALGILEDHYVNKMKITWRDCCAKACDDLISDCSGRTI